jgi:hypothetical protein
MLQRFRAWLLDTLTTEKVPYKALVYVFLIPSSLYGGWMFAATGSWLTAIQWDFWVYVVLWALVKPVEWIGECITRLLLWFLPLYTIE